MLHRTEGIVLRTFPFGEADLIVTYLTPDLGRLKLFAKSPRKIKSRFGSSLEPLTHSRISFWGKEDANLPRLTQSDIIRPFQSLRDNLHCFLKVQEIIELTLSFLPERDINKKAYYLLLKTLHDIENNSLRYLYKPSIPPIIPPHPPLEKGGRGDLKEGGKGGFEKKGGAGFSDGDLTFAHYKIKFLKFMGYTPKLDSCGRCGKKGSCFYIAHGSILCEACAEGIDLPIKLSPAVTRLYYDLLTWDSIKITRIKPSEKLLLQLSDVIDMHIKYILSKPLKTELFMQSLCRF
ncbi:MAG: DNA repair protein RecO [Nitrospirota bacterium]